MRCFSWVRKLILAGVCLSLASCADAENDVSIQGAGATFPAPLYKRWFLEYYRQHPEVRVNYQPIGSGAGIRQFNDGLPDFGASDAFDKKVAQTAYFLPMTAGSIAICYNLPGAPPDLKLGRDVYAGIFLGEIKQWDDPAIKECNPGVELPSTPITVVRRADSSGTTFAFTNHLSAVSKKWSQEGGGPGRGKSIAWPTGLAGRGNTGVAAIIQLTPGAIGYTETGYAELAQLAMARLANRAGNFVQPHPENNRSALSGENLKTIPDDFHIEITNPVGDDSYPIVTYTWMLVRRKYPNQQKGKALIEVLKYCLTEGQTFSSELGYIPLPQNLVEKVMKTIDKIEVGERGALAR